VKARRSIRWRILAFTALPLVGLGLISLALVHGGVTRQVHRSIREDLNRASAVFENMLAARAEELQIASQVIVRDPRFFSVLTLPASSRDEQFRATVFGVAADFNRITQSDLFEVLAADGRLLASVGSASSSPEGRSRLLGAALTTRPLSGVLIEPDAHFQVTLTPVLAGGRVVGALLLGSGLGQPLALRLRNLTRSEVTFLSGGVSTGSTLETSQDRDALLTTLPHLAGGAGANHGLGTIAEVRGATQTWITLARPLPGSSPEAGQWYVMQRSLDAESVFLREIQTHLLELGVLAVVVALLAGLFLAERMTSPVRRLVRAAEDMERGLYDTPIEIRDRDEMGYLAERFREMRAHQRAYVASLQEVTRLKSEFISVASHELRTPISIIKGFQDLFLQRTLGPLTLHQEQALEAIGRSISTLTRVADDATRMAQIEGERLQLEYEDDDLRNLVYHAIASVQAAAPDRKVEIAADLPPQPAMVRVDAPRLTHALANLISNGVRFTPDGGRVVVAAKLDGDQVQVQVTDSGVGIPSERRARLFDRGFVAGDSLHHHSSNTLEFNSAGLGMGLAITRGIVEAHGGTLGVESEAGRGSTFTIRLPARPDHAMAEAA
jgi:signal transduction histidine kinase